MVAIPGETELRAERAAFLATVEGLSDSDFQDGTTLCSDWSPRDLLAHVIGVDRDPGAYAKALGNVNRANAAIVEQGRRLTREQLQERGQQWASEPAAAARALAFFLLGDVSVHHQDLLRGLGRSREVPDYAARACLREGVVLGGRHLLTHRLLPDDAVGRPVGVGRRRVRGSTEALGMWLAGRRSVAADLTFA